MKDIEQIEHDFHSVAWVISQGWDLVLRGKVKQFSAGVCDGVSPSAHSTLD